MRKNIWVFMVLSTMGILTLTSCSKKAVVTPKQTDKSSASAKPGLNTGSTTANQSPATHTCGGNGYDSGSSNPGH